MFRRKLVRVVGIVFLFLVLIMVLVNLLKRNIYDSGLGMNLLVIADDGMGIVAVRSGLELISSTLLPDNLVIPIDFNGAEYQIEAIRKVGLPMENALEISRISVGQALGMVLNGIVKCGCSIRSDLVGGAREALFSWMSQSNLSWFDRYRLFRNISDLLKKKVDLIVSMPQGVVDVHIEPDGKDILKLNTAIFAWSKNQWIFDEILSETAEIVVVNGTGKEGKARLVAKQIEGSGVRVIGLVATDREVDDCIIFGTRDKHPKTFDFLASSYLCTIPDKEKKLADYMEDRDIKSDMVLVLGRRN